MSFLGFEQHGLQVVTSNTLVFTDDNILLKYYFACKNVSKDQGFDSMVFFFSS